MHTKKKTISRRDKALENEIIEVPNHITVEVTSSNLSFGGKVFRRGDRFKVADISGLEHFTKII